LGVYDFEHVVPGEYVVRLVDEDRTILASEVLRLPAGYVEGESVRFSIGD
jgi:hypothetical protein